MWGQNFVLSILYPPPFPPPPPPLKVKEHSTRPPPLPLHKNFDSYWVELHESGVGLVSRAKKSFVDFLEILTKN